MILLTISHISYTIFFTDSIRRRWLGEGIEMTYQNVGLLFLAVVAISFLIAFIEIIWKSRHHYYGGKAKPRGGNQNRH